VEEEVAPIRVDMATAYQMLGDRRAASRLYLELMGERRGSSSPDGGDGGTAAARKQLQFVIRHNLAVMTSSTNPTGASKSMPTLDDDDEGDDFAAMKMTPAQIRTVLYNRALLSLAAGRYEDSREALALLRSAIDPSSSSSPVGGTSSSKKQKKNKKNKNKGGGGAASSAPSPSLSAPPANAADEAIWSSRIALVESELLRAEGRADEAAATVESAIGALAAVASSLENDTNEQNDDDDDDDDGTTSEMMEAVQLGLAALYLHRLEVGRIMAASLAATADGDDAEAGEEDPENSDDGAEEKNDAEDDVDAAEAAAAALALDPIEILSNLPSSIKTRPAVLGALSALYSQAGREDRVEEIIELLSSSPSAGGGGSGGGDADSARIKSAHFIRSGRYGDAITVLRSALGTDDLSEEDRLELTARLAQALSYVDPAEAEELASSLQDGGESSVLPDGEELEGRETPRLGKGASAIGRKPGGAADGDGKQSQEKKKKREAALRRRAKKREAYLAKLEEEGRYNADRPSKPDPERWIPKAQRSYSRRGRRGRQRFVGAQGGGTGAGADRDAARLDAAARAAAKRDGTAASPSKPSTAHMEVSGGGHGRRKGGRR